MKLRTCVSGGKGLWRGGCEGNFPVTLLALLACRTYFAFVCVNVHVL